MKTNIDISIQRVNLSQSKQKVGAIKKTLSNKKPSENELFVERDGYLIRYASELPTRIGIEPMLTEIRNLGIIVASSGDFTVVEERQGTCWVLTVKGWIPREFKPVDKDEYVGKEEPFKGLTFLCGSGPIVDLAEYNSESLFQLPSFEVPKSSYTKNLKRIFQLKALAASIAGGVLIAGLLIHNLNTEEVKQEIQNIVVKPEGPITVDPYEKFRAEQSQRVSLARALYALQPMAIKLRPEALPRNWQMSKVTFVGNSLRGNITPTGGSHIGKIRDAKNVLLTGPNGKYIHIDGQAITMHVPIKPDGLGLVGKRAKLAEVRDPFLDFLADLGATSLKTSKPQRFVNFEIQNGEVMLPNVDLDYVGLISRRAAGLPIYISALDMDYNSNKLNLKLTFTFVGQR